jgi:hypothetical protein
MMGMLAAIPDAWVIALPIVLLIIQVVQAVIMWNLDRKTDRIDSLESDLKTAMAQAINAKFSSYEQDIKRIYDRLERGENHFAKLDEMRHKLEVDVLRELSELKDIVATKDELKQVWQAIHRD